MVPIPLDNELERRVREVAARQGEDFGSYISKVLLRQVEEDEALTSVEIDRLLKQAASDPLFLKDIDDSMRAFDSADRESAGLLPDD